jgi:3alpha(or 20beta)-hydroxysteroid dehydrogenase
VGRLEGKTALVTGACGSIGMAIAERFAEEGATVAIADLSGELTAAGAARISERGEAAFGIELDVASEQSWQAACEATVARTGRLDILVNNAGVNDRGTIMSTVVNNWDHTIAVNLTGALLGMRSVAPIMRSNGGGAIVNTCSLASHHGEVFAGYGASKWGLRGLTKIAAMEFVDWGIRVNSISPAVVETKINAAQPYIQPFATITPMGRNGQVMEVANAILFLASDEASFITGQDLAVDGGFTAGAAAKFVHGLAKKPS